MSKKTPRNSIYEPFKDACKKKDTYISVVLRECGWADSNIGQWKKGAFPRLDMVMDVAEYLGISLDELCYGRRDSKSITLNDSEKEWLEIFSRIPENKQQMCKDFLETHAVVPEKYEDLEKRTS